MIRTWAKLLLLSTVLSFSSGYGPLLADGLIQRRSGGGFEGGGGGGGGGISSNVGGGGGTNSNVGGGGGSSHWGGHTSGGFGRSSVVIKRRQYNIPRPDVIHNSRHIINDRSRVAWPRRDATGAVITQRPAMTAPLHHTTIIQNKTILQNVNTFQRTEIVPNHYYWHTVSGVQFCHYYYGGAHWYGFYFGPSFYWTRYYGSRWWWYDPTFARWVYWWDGYWWWPGPAGVPYVYVDNNYYPYEDNGVVVSEPEEHPAPQEAPSLNEGSTWTSPDGTRMVQIVGPRLQAFLYDKSSGSPSFMKFIGEGVENVRFSGGGGKPVEILLNFKDGTFALFSENGDPLDVRTRISSPPPTASPPPEQGKAPSGPPPGPPTAQ